MLREHGVVDSNPAELLTLPKRPRSLPHVLRPDELAQLLDRIAAATPLELRDRAMLELAYASGLRAEELVDADASTRVDFDAEQVRVEGKGSKTASRAGRRAGAARAARLPRARRGRRSRTTASAALLLSKSGRPLSTSDVRRRLRDLVGARRARRRGPPARAAPLLRDPSAQRRRRPARDPGAARALEHLDNAGLHSSRVCATETRLRKQSPASVAGSVSRIREHSVQTNVKAVELRDLWRRYKTSDDQKARDRLVVAYSPLVKYVAGRMGAGLPAHVDEADLISYGLGGLIAAIERFDLEPRDPLRDLRDHAHQGRDPRRAARARLGAALGARPRPPDRARQRQARGEAAARPDRGGARRRARDDRSRSSAPRCCRSPTPRSARSTSSGARPTRAATAISLLDTLSDPSAPDPERIVEQNELRDRIAEALERLPEREKLVIALYYYENLTLREIGEVLRRDRVARLAAAHQGRARPALAPHAPHAEPALAAPVRAIRAYVERPRRRGEYRMAYSAEAIRNVALVGHRGAGKTSLHEALLFEAGVLTGSGPSTDGTTASDTEADEQARQMSISMTLSSFEWHERKINLLDTPGEPSFIADALGALRVCESAVFVVNAVMGAEVTTRRLWKVAAERDIARMLFVNMLDRERADFYRTLDSLKARVRPARRRDRDPDRQRARGAAA